VDFVSRVDHALRGRVFIELQQRIGEAHLRLGERAPGLAALDLAVEAYDRRMRNVPDDPMSPYYAAGAHALRGDVNAAVACLERTARFRPVLTARRAAIEPALEPLRTDERFRAIVSVDRA
jgi:tetratricopeptide (TPR) repeat protein